MTTTQYDINIRPVGKPIGLTYSYRGMLHEALTHAKKWAFHFNPDDDAVDITIRDVDGLRLKQTVSKPRRAKA